jgi:hypothetical protein
MLAVRASPTAANASAVKEISFPLRPVNINASGGELRHTAASHSALVAAGKNHWTLYYEFYCYERSG